MEGERRVTGSIIDELHSSDIQGDQMEGEGGVTRSIIDEPHSLGLVKWKVKVVLLEVSLMNFNLGICKEVKWKVEVVLLEVSLINFIPRLSNEIKCKVKVDLWKYL